MNDEQLAARLRQLLEQRSEQLDGDTLRHLQRARYEALEAASRRADWQEMFLAFGGLAAVVVLAFSLALLIPSHNPAATMAIDLDLMASEQQLQFYESLDFYMWLEEQDEQS